MRETDENGIKKLKLTSETIHHIFLMYPAVKRAYEAKVPDELTEQEFWTKYFQSEYFTRDKGTGSTAAYDNSSGKLSRTDDIFARFEQQQNTSSKGSSMGNHKNVVIHSDVDLCSSYGDYRAPEMLYLADKMNSNKPTPIVDKYNRNSLLVMEQQYTQDGDDVDMPRKVTKRDGNETKYLDSSASLQELNVEPPSEFILLHLNVHHAQKSGRTSPNIKVEVKTENRDEKSIMISNSNGNVKDEKRSLGKVLAHDVSNVHKRSPTSGITLEEINANMNSCFPPPDRAIALLKQHMNDVLTSDTATVKSTATSSTGTSAIPSGSLPADFQQVLT